MTKDGQEIPEVLAGDEGKFSVSRPKIGFIPSLLEEVQEAHGYLAHHPLFFILVKDAANVFTSH